MSKKNKILLDFVSKSKKRFFYILGVVSILVIVITAFNTEASLGNIVYNIFSATLAASIIYLLTSALLINEDKLKDFFGTKTTTRKDLKKIQNQLKDIKTRVVNSEMKGGEIQFFSQRNEQYFFDQVISIIENASKSIYSIGSGLLCETEQEQKYSEDLAEAMERFISSSSGDYTRKIIHIQDFSRVSIKWLKILQKLSLDNDVFKIHTDNTLKNPDSNKFRFWKIMTDREEENSRTIILHSMLNPSIGGYKFCYGIIYSNPDILRSSYKMFESYLDKCDVFSSYKLKNFIDKKTRNWELNLEGYLKKNVGKINTDSDSILDEDNILKTCKELDIYDYGFVWDFYLKRFMKNRYYYFSYGENIASESMQKNCSDFRVIKVVYLKGYTLNYEGYDNVRKSNVLNIKKTGVNTDTVKGVLYGIKKLNFTSFSLKMKSERKFNEIQVPLSLISELNLTEECYLYYQKKTDKNKINISENYQEMILRTMQKLKFLASDIENTKEVFESIQSKKLNNNA